jgi:tRNA threonylcarbamoyl adenosine modification protein (Sua5/YciO/YrdC/YwlC family)
MKLLTIDQAIELILENKIVAVPTETVYGLFGLANSAQAVSNVYNIKNRPSDNPLICHFYSPTQIFEYVEKPPVYICKLIELVGPGSLTYVLQLKPNSRLAPACAGLSTVCCRIPDCILALALLQKINIPLFGPSANTSTKVSGVTAEMIDQDLGDKIAGIINGGQSSVGLESTIIDTLEMGKIKILRPGVIGKKELEGYLEQLGFVKIKVLENEKVQSVTPGAKYRHYSPKTKIYLVEEKDCHLEQVRSGGLGLPDQSLGTTSERSCASTDKTSIIFIGLKEFQLQKTNYISLGSKDNLSQVSADFYLNLFLLDQKGIESCIFDKQSYETIRDSQLSLAKALFNRLEKVIR